MLSLLPLLLGLIVPLEGLEAGSTYRVYASLVDPTGGMPGAMVMLEGAAGERIRKTLHPGDPDLTITYRPATTGTAQIRVEGAAAVRTEWSRLDVPAADRDRFEAEPNDDWRHANPLTLGRPVYGTADDVDDLDNADEGRAGLDWFRLDVPDEQPFLATFRLELVDRDVSANLRVYRIDELGQPRLFETGKDPTEVIHDRERERYSVYLTRTLTRGVYYVEVNSNHPAYTLRSQRRPLPPYADPSESVRTGLDYLLDAGDAWFAQTPREGYVYTRAANLHDTAVRCTACHASNYPPEAALVGLQNGYPVESKTSLANLVARLANSPTPLYGDRGLFWQRYIAIPLQSQGKQGGILADFDRVLGRASNPATERFVPFLRAAWARREAIPDDEQNGVVPADSKFALLWRDWRVLELAARRTGRVALARAADNIADILAEPATDRRVETFQDRLHRLQAWHVIDHDRYLRRIEDEADALFALQNDDGGWHELGRHPAPSAIYTTGQIAWTLMEVGVPRDDPRIVRALRWLQTKQQPFGGWFQATTHENFRTPMRETRYAVEALARGFPRPGGPINSWQNGDGGPPRTPRMAPLAATLDDLDNLWDLPDPDRAIVLPAVARLLTHAEPVVRDHAAACLGRVGDGSIVPALAAVLGDQSKAVRRSAAWALRTLANRGVDPPKTAVAAALQSPDPWVRRGAVRVFTAQFYGLDERVDLADRLIAMTEDRDLEVRLGAIRALRQWFYRTADDGLRGRIVAAYLARMAVPDAPVIRRALTEGMYILLDENLGGGVSLQRNLMALPEAEREPALEARRRLERDVLLGPILRAAETGNSLQREAIVASFDGSSFRGRGYARQPTGTIDVGNDREFGFLIEPEATFLDRSMRSLLDPSSGLSAESRARAIRLAGYFGVGHQTADPVIQTALLRGLTDPDPTVQQASRDAVAKDLALVGAEDDPARVALVLALLHRPGEARRAIAAAVGRNGRLLECPEVWAEVRAQIASDPRGLVPLLRSGRWTEADIGTAITRAWPDTPEPRDRLAWLELIAARPGWLASVVEPNSTVAKILRVARSDPATTVRERAFNLSFEGPTFAGSRGAGPVVVAALGDATPQVRRLGLGLAGLVPGFWERPDGRDRLQALLVDPDREVRTRALGVVERGPIPAELVPRVKAVAMADPSLRDRAEAALRTQGIDPASIAPDATLARPRMLSLGRFRAKVEPWLTRPGTDGVSCRSCHGNHAVFRVIEPDPTQGIDENAATLINYASALRALDLGDPDRSRLIRKPRSPQGQGAADSTSPTGLTHGGGTRWDDADHPAIREILGWVRESTEDEGRKTAVAMTSDGYSPDHPPALASDGDLNTLWRTEFVGATPGYPHDLVVDLGQSRAVRGLLYVPRQDASNGRVSRYEVSLSSDGQTWDEPVARGLWPDDPAFQFVELGPNRQARFVRLRGRAAVDGGTEMAVAELVVELAPEPPGATTQ